MTENDTSGPIGFGPTAGGPDRDLRGRHELAAALAELVPAEHILVDEPMARHTSFRTGGPADLMVRAGSEEELATAVRFLRDAGENIVLLGRGTNVLVSDRGIRGAVVTMAGSAIRVTDSARYALTGQDLREGEASARSAGQHYLYAEAGAKLSQAAVAARDAHLAGLEFAHGIPGSVGGAIVMNAGAYGGEMAQVVRRVRMMTPELEIVVRSGEEMEFGYRTSRVRRDGCVVLGALMELDPGDPYEITARMEDLMARRREKQPLEYPSAGSTFKRPEGDFAGRLIQEAGLRGFSVGGAQVSEKHCGFVINRGGASSAEILALIREVQRRVCAHAGVMLEREIILLGFDEEEM